MGLETAVQIYSRRVDSIHNSALDTRLRLSLSLQEVPPEEKAPNESAVTSRRRAKRRSDFNGDSTLVTNMDSITVKEADDTSFNDLLFHKMSALFDASNFRSSQKRYPLSALKRNQAYQR